MSNNPSLIIAQLRQAGHKITSVRREMLAALASATSPLSPKEIIARLARRGLSPHKTTVYRELDFLNAQKVVRSLVFADTQPRYELVNAGHFHHLICLKCKTVDKVELDNDVDKAERHIARRTKFRVLRHSLEFYGLCARCRG